MTPPTTPTTAPAPQTPQRPPCRHTPPCPGADAADGLAAHVLVSHPEQGWSLLCNGIVVFEDFGELLPDGRAHDARRHDLLLASPHRRAS